MDIRTFELRRAVIHDVPPPDVGRHGPLVLTDEPITLDEELRSYFSRKVVETLGHRGLDVVADATQAPTAREAVVAVRRSTRNLVAQSRVVAEHLHRVQTNINSPGLLAVALAEIDDKPCLAVLKLEREQGVHFHITTEHGGRNVIDLELLRELTLTDRTRVFKTGVLQVGVHGGADDVVGRVSDDQRGREDGVGVADFWMAKFLGCGLAVSPARATKDFVEVAERFLNEQVPDAERRARYQVALLARMQDNVMEVRPRSFAESTLEAGDRASFLQEVQAAGLDPNVAFHKDTSLVRVEKGFHMTFDSGMVLIGSINDLDERVKAQRGGERTVINDTQRALRGR